MLRCNSGRDREHSTVATLPRVDMAAGTERQGGFIVQGVDGVPKQCEWAAHAPDNNHVGR